MRRWIIYPIQVIKGTTSMEFVQILWSIHCNGRTFIRECKEWIQGETLPGYELHCFVEVLRNGVCIKHVYHCLDKQFLGTTNKERHVMET